MYAKIEIGPELPAGYATESVMKGEQVPVAISGFASTADGQSLIRMLEQFPSEVLSKLPGTVQPSQVDDLLVIIHPTGTAKVYVNEVSAILTARAKGTVSAGQPMAKDDIADIEKMEFVDIETPRSAGFIYFFSIGWRRELFYDFGPLIGEEKQLRTYDLASTLGRVYTQVLFQERFSISDAAWSALFSSRWFLFSGLSDKLIEKMIAHVRAEWNPDELLDEIAAEVTNKVPDMLSSWGRHPAFKGPLTIVEAAVTRFLDGDYISCTSTLYPRIEGILRTYHRSIQPGKRISPKKLAFSAVSGKRDNLQSLVLPQRFEAYLNEVYFRDFDPSAAEIEVSRHSVSHGEASAKRFDRESSVISILIIHQLFYTFESRSDDCAGETSKK